jgi:hypothetical protein
MLCEANYHAVKNFCLSMTERSHIFVKNGVLSAFGYQCAECYNVSFTGLTLIPLVKTYYTCHILLNSVLSSVENIFEFEFLKGFPGTIFCHERFL